MSDAIALDRIVQSRGAGWRAGAQLAQHLRAEPQQALLGCALRRALDQRRRK